MLKRSDDRASVAERRNVCARRSGAADGLLFSLFVWLGASDRSWADYSPIYCTAGVDPSETLATQTRLSLDRSFEQVCSIENAFLPTL
jgi:hypothetical protein